MVAAAQDPEVETDGHVTQWQRQEMNGGEKRGETTASHWAAEYRTVFKPQGGRRAGLRLSELMASFPVMGIPLGLRVQG